MKIILILAAVAISSAWALPEIEPKLKGLTGSATANIMITLSNSTDAVLASITAHLDIYISREDRLEAVHNALVAHATLTQAAVIAALAPFSAFITYTSYWVSNQIFIEGATSALIAVLSRMSVIARIEAEFFIQIGSPVRSLGSGGEVQHTLGTNVYGVEIVQADDVWDMGCNGTGVLVANIDTGVRGTHEAFASRFLGKFGWYDPTLRLTKPYDDNGHGTHTMGTMIGSGGIGMAPGAKWAACKGCSFGSCSNNALTACGQFFTCPNDGAILFPKKDCSKAPHIINNSWGGGQGDSWYNSIINAWRAAGIIPVFSAGNSGPDCGTANSPGDQPNIITVGSTDEADALSEFSSVGPTKGGLIKPDLVGPGSDVISAYFTSDTAYQIMSGTSMSSPAVAGIVALLKCKNIALSYDQTYQALTQNCDQNELQGNGQTCGGKSDSDWPNNSFGWGRVNAYRAIQTL